MRGYEEYEDLPVDARVRTYSLEEIAVEKVVALGDRARNEPRDLYDVWYLTAGGHVDLGRLTADIERKAEFLGKSRADLREEFGRKATRFEKLWSLRLATQMAELPEFDGVYRAVQRSFRRAGLMTR